MLRHACRRLSSTITSRATSPSASSLAASAVRRQPHRLMSSAGAESDGARIARWSARLGHDNTFLSYHRNAIIATVAGCALINYRKGEGRPPLAGAGLLVMGGLYIYVGSGLYVWQTFKLRSALKIGPAVVLWSIFNALWPLGIWSVSLACLLDETPSWLIEGLRHSESLLPATLRSSLFIDPPVLYPVCRLLHAVLRHEERRLATVRDHADRSLWAQPLAPKADALEGHRPKRRASLAGGWAGRGGGGGGTASGGLLSSDADVLLSDADVAGIISKRLERLVLLKAKLDVLARSEQSVPTALAVPLLDTLQSEAELLEKVLEVDTAQGDTPSFVWWLSTAFSAEHKRLRGELEAVQALQRRLAAVKFTSVAFTARALSDDGRIAQPASASASGARASAMSAVAS